MQLLFKTRESPLPIRQATRLLLFFPQIYYLKHWLKPNPEMEIHGFLTEKRQHASHVQSLVDIHYAISNERLFKCNHLTSELSNRVISTGKES